MQINGEVCVNVCAKRQTEREREKKKQRNNKKKNIQKTKTNGLITHIYKNTYIEIYRNTYIYIDRQIYIDIYILKQQRPGVTGKPKSRFFTRGNTLRPMSISRHAMATPH